MKIDKAYFTVSEVIDRWGMAKADFVYLAETGDLRLSVRVFGVALEIGDLEEDGSGGCFTIPHSQSRYSGLLDLHTADAFRVFRDGAAPVRSFLPPSGDYATVLNGADEVTVRIADLLVRKQERDRVEARIGFRATGFSAPDLQVSEDFSKVRLADLFFEFGPIQAEVIRRLHAAHQAGEPWCNGKELLSAAGSRSLRMADVFKSKPMWRQLILSNRRGLYRLAID